MPNPNTGSALATTIHLARKRSSNRIVGQLASSMEHMKYRQSLHAIVAQSVPELRTTMTLTSHPDLVRGVLPLIDQWKAAGLQFVLGHRQMRLKMYRQQHLQGVIQIVILAALLL